MKQIYLIFLCSISLILSCGESKNKPEKVIVPPPIDLCTEGDNYCIKVATFNVLIGQRASPTVIANKFANLNLDILTLTECPTLIDPNSGDKDFVEIIANTLNMPYWKIGTISSGDHWQEWGTDASGKYHGKLKAILSKTPLTNSEDILLQGSGWNPSSAFKAKTVINNSEYAIYSLHIPGNDDEVSGSVHKDLADRILANDTSENIIVMGDFNDTPSNETMNYINGKGFRNAFDDLDNIGNRIDSFSHGRIDNILYNDSSNIKSLDGYSIFNSSISDHPYVWFKILYK